MSAKKSAAKKRRSDGLAHRIALRARRGQAMVEYSIVTHFLLIGGSLALLPVMSKLFDALSKYYESIFMVLNTGAI